MGSYTRTPRGPATHAVALNRGGRRIAVFYEAATDDEIDACLTTLNDRALHGQPRQVG